jgi:hypothetical protein
MSRKQVLLPVTIASAQSLAADFTTTPTVISYQDNIAYQINVTTADSAGTFAVQASMDYEAGVNGSGPPVAGNWTTLTLSGTPTVAAANDTIMISLNQVPYKALRLAYTSSVAGTGVCNI